MAQTAAATSAATTRTFLRTIPQKLPSLLHASAVADGTLLSDASQSIVLPKLDAIIHSLPSYKQSMLQHSQQLQQLETIRSSAVSRDKHRRKSTPLFHRLQRVASGTSPTTPPDALPNSYYRIPEPPSAPTPPKGVYLYGDVGCGKSLLMDMLFTCAKPVLTSKNAARVHYHAFMSGVYTMIHRYDGMTDSERERKGVFHPLDAVVGQQLGRINNSSAAANGGGGLLCFDEFQVADVADARLMHGIFDRLMNAGTVVCFTANRAPSDLNRSQLRDRDFMPFLDLIHDRCDLVHIASGIDYREQLMEADSNSNNRNHLYLHANDKQSLRKVWENVSTSSDWNDVTQVTVQVAHGRQLVLNRARKNGSAVQLTCAELIEAAVGASDYRALCNFTKYIFISDVLPIFTNDTRNYARRFITLIDVCYESKVRIVMRMEADTLDEMFDQVDVSGDMATALEGLQFEGEVGKEGVGADNRHLDQDSTLFSGEDEVFAFRRAVSRLKEMQTEGFGKRGIFAL